MRETLRWLDDENAIEMIDQTLLPNKFKLVKLKTVEATAAAIEDMTVRGAPAIGVTAAMGVALGAVKFRGKDRAEFQACMENVCDRLARTRPTAVNLFWAIDRMKGILKNHSSLEPEKIKNLLVEEAKEIWREDIEANRKMGEFGAGLLKKGTRILTHCNAGSLATVGYGTALGVIRSAYKKGLIEMVYADETRPRLQGAKLTAFEMKEEGIPCTLICDNSAAALMAKNLIDAVVVGADRIAANGDTANKIGTYSLAIVSKAHNIPFYVAAPVSTIDFNIKEGREIPIEERDGDEVRKIGAEMICPEGMEVANYAFDVTPAKLIAAIITEKGVAEPPSKKTLVKFKN